MAKNSPDEGKSTKMVEKQVDPSFNNLKEYRAKRQFSETPEPMADTAVSDNQKRSFKTSLNVERQCDFF